MFLSELLALAMKITRDTVKVTLTERFVPALYILTICLIEEHLRKSYLAEWISLLSSSYLQ